MLFIAFPQSSSLFCIACGTASSNPSSSSVCNDLTDWSLLHNPTTLLESFPSTSREPLSGSHAFRRTIHDAVAQEQAVIPMLTAYGLSCMLREVVSWHRVRDQYLNTRLGVGTVDGTSLPVALIAPWWASTDQVAMLCGVW